MRALLVENGAMRLVEDLEVRPPGPHEVRVAISASGICRSDLLLLEYPRDEPTALGHEGAGVVAEVGDLVTTVSVGDPVAVTCQRPCNRCEQCARGRFSACPTTMADPTPPFSIAGEPVLSMARSSSMASQVVVDELQVHRVPDLDLGGAALLGCAVSTGFGMVANVGELQRGERVAVIGVGGIGINSIQGARLLGACHIVAIDVNPKKADLALQFGADQFILADPSESPDQMAARITAEMGGPVDVVVEGSGVPAVVTGSLGMLNIGGRLALVGIPVGGGDSHFDLNDAMMRHLTIRGALNGGCDPFVDMPHLVRLARSGLVDLEAQVTHRFPLDDYKEAFDMLQSGEALRVVIDMTS